MIAMQIGALVPAALTLVCKRGRVVCAGIPMSDIPIFAYADLWEERQILSVANLTREDGTSFFEVAARSGLRAVTETFPLEQANVALDRLRKGTLTGAAVVISPQADAASGNHG